MMIKIKSADRIKIRTEFGMREVKGEKYRGFGINEDNLIKGRWHLTIIEGRDKGMAVVSYTKKKDCRKLADKLIEIFNRTDLVEEEVRPYSDVVIKCGTIIK